MRAVAQSLFLKTCGSDRPGFDYSPICVTIYPAQPSFAEGASDEEVR